jgi:PAS domain S-box-containing protein
MPASVSALRHGLSSWWRRFRVSAPAGEADRRPRPAQEVEASASYRDLVENSLGLICTHDLDGRLLSINPVVGELLGYDPAEVVGMNLRDLLVPAVRPSFDPYLSRLRHLTTDSGYMRVLTRGGDERILYYRNRLCHRPGKEPYVLGHAQDLTDHKRAERGLKRAQEELLASHGRRAAIVEAALDAVLTLDAEGRICEFNPAAERVLGWPPEEALGRHVLDVVELPGLRSPGPVSLETYFASGHGIALGQRIETRGRRADGASFPLELAITRLPGDGPATFTGFLRDLSERHEIERLKAQFIATVSHELRTPLTSLRGALGLLAGGVLGELPVEARNAVEIAQRSILRLVSLVNDILDVERLENGGLSLQIGSHSLAALLARSAEEVGPLAAEAGIALEVGHPAGVVEGDGDRLVQVIVNLLSNAFKFSPRGSTVRLQAWETPDRVEVQVEDEGRGIPPAHREAIFDRFRQLDLSDAAGQRGAGLGLAIAKSIVELHGGEIGVDSEEGRGSVFWFRIPRALTPVPSPASSPAFGRPMPREGRPHPAKEKKKSVSVPPSPGEGDGEAGEGGQGGEGPM